MYLLKDRGKGDRDRDFYHVNDAQLKKKIPENDMIYKSIISVISFCSDTFLFFFLLL